MVIEGYPKDALLEEASSPSNDEIVNPNETGENEILLQSIEPSPYSTPREENIVKTQQAMQRETWGDVDKIKIYPTINVKTTTTRPSDTNHGLVGNGDFVKTIKKDRKFEEGI